MKKSLTNNGVVKVGVHPDTGLVITQNPNKPEFGSIRLDYKTATLSGGFSSIGNRSAFIHGRMEDLEAYRDWETDRKSTRLNSSHITRSRMPSSA